MSTTAIVLVGLFLLGAGIIAASVFFLAKKAEAATEELATANASVGELTDGPVGGIIRQLF